jgi:hypothetical protein
LSFFPRSTDLILLLISLLFSFFESPFPALLSPFLQSVAQKLVSFRHVCRTPTATLVRE